MASGSSHEQERNPAWSASAPIDTGLEVIAGARNDFQLTIQPLD